MGGLGDGLELPISRLGAAKLGMPIHPQKYTLSWWWSVAPLGRLLRRQLLFEHDVGFQGVGMVLLLKLQLGFERGGALGESRDILFAQF